MTNIISLNLNHHFIQKQKKKRHSLSEGNNMERKKAPTGKTPCSLV